MNALELKGSLLEMVSNVHSEATLEKLIQLFKKTVQEQEVDWWDELTEEQQSELEMSLAECDDPSKLTSHDKVMQMSEQWLNE
jgi:thiamine pyrophosphate-dependent acetolactate synthase large subunit-like protein